MVVRSPILLILTWLRYDELRMYVREWASAFSEEYGAEPKTHELPRSVPPPLSPLNASMRTSQRHTHGVNIPKLT